MAASDPDNTDNARDQRGGDVHQTLIDEAERNGDATAATPTHQQTGKREAFKQRSVFEGPPSRPSDPKKTVETLFRPEADTLTTHGALSTSSPPPQNNNNSNIRRDTLPAPPLPRTPTVPPLFPPPARPPLGPPPLRQSTKMRIVTPPHSMMTTNPPRQLADDDDHLELEEVDDDLDDDTTTTAEPYVSEDPTSPTLSLEQRSDNSREVYRLFLASDYAPALKLANELIAQGDDDPMLVTIARECRSSLMNPTSYSSAPPPSPLPPPPPSSPASASPHHVATAAAALRSQQSLFAGIHGTMTLEQLAAMTGLSLDQLLRLLERFITMGVLTLRPPPR